MVVTIKELQEIQDDRWYSATDIQNTYGKSHQYWSKIMKQGKLRGEKTSAGYITTQTWLDTFFTN